MTGSREFSPMACPDPSVSTLPGGVGKVKASNATSEVSSSEINAIAAVSFEVRLSTWANATSMVGDVERPRSDLRGWRLFEAQR